MICVIEKIIKRIKNWRSDRFLIACIINLMVFVILNTTSYATFDNKIDIMMKSVLSNIGGLYGTSHVVFSNIFLAKTICILMAVIPEISWYTWFVVMAAFVAISILGYLILYNHGGKSHIVVLCAFYIFLGYQCYIFPSYIKTAIVLTFAGIMMGYHAFRLERKSIKYYCVADIVLILASLYSMTGFLLGLVGGLVMVVVQLVIKKEYSFKLIVFGGQVVLSILVVLFLSYIDESAYINGPEGEDIALEYRHDIEELLVFGYPGYDEKYLDDLFINESQYNSMFADGHYLVKNETAENLDVLHEISNEHITYTSETALGFFKTVLWGQIKVGYLYLFVIIAFLLMCSVTRNREAYIISGIVIAIVAGFIAYLNYAWDSKVTQLAIYLPIIYLMISNMKRIDGIARRDIIVGFMVLGVVLYNNFSDQIVTSVPKPDEMKEELAEKNMGATRVAINLCDFLDDYSAYAVYPEDLLYEVNCFIMDGSYFIYPSMRDYMYATHYNEPIVWDAVSFIDLSNYYIVQ